MMGNLADTHKGKPGRKKVMQKIPACRATHSQQGIALITALLIISLVTIAAVAMAERQTLDIRRTENLLHYDQAYMYAIAAEDWAGQMLMRDPDMKVDSLEEIAMAQLVAIPVDGGTISGGIQDATARFPINNMLDANGQKNPVYITAFQRFVDYMTSNNKCGEGTFNPTLGDIVVDWIDQDTEASPGGAEDMEYLNLERPYRAANQPIASISELRAINNIIGEEYRCYVGNAERQPFVNAVREKEVAINVNTAPIEVLQSVHSLIDDQVLAAALENREKEPFEDIDKFLKKVKDNIKFNTDENHKEEREFDEAMKKVHLSVGTKYFEVTAVAQIGRMQMTLVSLLKREDNKVTTLQRSIGVF